jgi:glucose-6-phosphate 1-epimerase
MPTERLPLASYAGQPALRLEADDGATATVLLHGGHVVSWVPAGSREQLYLSPDTQFGEGVAVRGGVPVIFPQFNERGPLPRHGLVRTRSWEPVDVAVRAGRAVGVLRFCDDPATRAHWPHRFVLELRVGLGGNALDLELEVHNTGDQPFCFHAALHTYLRCDDATTLRLEGLQDCEFEDFAPGAAPTCGRQEGAALVLDGRPVDRVYAGAKRPLALCEPGRRVGIEMREYADVVVWNPAAAGANRIADLPGDGWRHLLCVEAARILAPVQLMPGERWIGVQSLRA